MQAKGPTGSSLARRIGEQGSEPFESGPAVHGKSPLGTPAVHRHRAQLVDRQAGDDRGQVGLRRLERLAVFERAVQAQQALLDEILGLAHAAEHAVGDPEGAGPQLLVELLCHGHFIPVAKPSRQLA